MYKTSTPYLFSGCVMLMDTDKERSIGLGTSYKQDQMKEGECMISKDIAKNLALQEGDIMYLSLQMYQNLVSLIQMFNREVATPNELPLISVYSITSGGISSKVRIPCRVKHVMDGTYDKFPKETAKD